MKRRAPDDCGSIHRQRHIHNDTMNGNFASSHFTCNNAFPPDSQGCRSQDSDSGQDSAAASDAAVAGAPSVEGLNYPHPKNFAERLMNVLERGIAADCIWWVGDDIHGVALQPKKLKKGTLLQTHFSGNKYSAFLRSFNRWGFRRVACHNVSDGSVVYKNSLFRMDKPHLVKHMRMDSDVQDVFERHQLPGVTTSRGSSPSGAVASMPAAVSMQGSSGPGGEMSAILNNGNSNDITNMLQQLLTAMANPQGQQQQQQQQQQRNPFLGNDTNSGYFQPQDSLPALPAANTGGAFHGQQGPQGAVAIPGQSQPSLVDNQLLASAQPEKQRAPKASDIRPPQQVTPQNGANGGSDMNQVNGDILSSALELLVRQIRQGENKPAPEPLRNQLLRQILEAADKYMEQPPSTSVAGLKILTTLELLKIIGKEELEADSGKRD